MNKELLKTFYFIETIHKMYFVPDFHMGKYEILLNVDSDNPKNPRIVELFYFPYQKFDFRSLYRDKSHYSSFEMDNDGKIYEIIDKSSKIYEIIDKSSPELNQQLAKDIISLIDKDLEKTRKTVYSSIGTLISIYEQTLKGVENMNKAIEEGRDLHIFKKLWEAHPVRRSFDLERFEGSLKRDINWILSVLKKLKNLTVIFQGIKGYTILKEIPKKLYVIKVEFVANYKGRYAYYDILIDDDKIKVSIRVEYDIEVVKEIYTYAELVVSPFDYWEWRDEVKYREKAKKHWYYLLRPKP